MIILEIYFGIFLAYWLIKLVKELPKWIGYMVYIPIAPLISAYRIRNGRKGLAITIVTLYVITAASWILILAYS